MSADNGLGGFADAISLGIEEWNRVVTQAWPIRVQVTSEGIEVIYQNSERILGNQNYFPEIPGPFKRISAFCILATAHQFFTIQDDTEDELNAWHPRIIAWMIYYLGRHLKINGCEKNILWMGFPSPHFKLEYLAYLRNLDLTCRQKKESNSIAMPEDALIEKIILSGLILEACYYASTAPFDQGIRGNTDDCLSKIESGSVQAIDLLFDDDAFYENAFGWGTN